MVLNRTIFIVNMPIIMKYIYENLLTYLPNYLLTYLLIYFLTSESLNLKGYIVNIDTERAFHY